MQLVPRMKWVLGYRFSSLQQFRHGYPFICHKSLHVVRSDCDDSRNEDVSKDATYMWDPYVHDVCPQCWLFRFASWTLWIPWCVGALGASWTIPHNQLGTLWWWHLAYMAVSQRVGYHRTSSATTCWLFMNKRISSSDFLFQTHNIWPICIRKLRREKHIQEYIHPLLHTMFLYLFFFLNTLFLGFF